MVSICRRPVNCYNDRIRYRIMFIFHTFDVIFFIIRLSLVSNDISKGVSSTMSFLIPILIFDLIGSIPLIICNIIYVILHHCIQPSISKGVSFPYLWRVGTMTCVRLRCHTNRPQGILLMRILFILSSFMLKFICFIIGASCSARFQSQCTAYAVVAGFALVSSIIVITVEFVHFFRLWNYNPTDPRNDDTENSYTIAQSPRIRKTHRRLLRFIHYSLLNDQNAQGFRRSRCEKGSNCISQSLHHHLLYHSLEAEHDFNVTTLTDTEKQSFIAYYETTATEAYEIAERGFPYGDNAGNTVKDYLHLRKNIFFKRSCRSSTAEAITGVRLNLGRVVSLASDQNLDLHTYFGRTDGTCDTLYAQNSHRFYLRLPAQIEKWIVKIKANTDVNDKLDGAMYQSCL